MLQTILRSALVCFLLISLSACHKREETTTAGNGGGSGDASTVKVVYIPKNTGNPYFNSLLGGFEAGCKSQGVGFLSIGPANPDATSQIPFIQDQAQQHVSAICISPNSVDALNQACDDARAKGVKIVMVNSDITGNESHRDAAVFPTDFSKVGPSQIELLGSLIGYTGKFAILSSTTDAPDQNFWIEGMKTALKDPKYAKMELVDIVYGDDKPEKSRKEAEGLLIKHPDLRGILSPTTVGVEQAAKAVQTAGVYPGGPSAQNGGIVVTGLGTPDQMRDYIKGDIIPAVALWSPYDEGDIAACLATGLAKGTIHADAGQTFDVPGKGTFTFGKNGTVIAGPPVVFTKANIDQYHF
jgi:rhamnose transport system substrate-binding protein